MSIPVFDFIASLEQDIADLYGKLQSIAQLRDSHELFDFMKEHSMIHSEIVGNLKSKYTKPVHNIDFIKNVHEQIKKTLIEEIIASKDINTAIDKLAKNEELVGKMYRILSEHYIKLSDYYKNIAIEISHVADEEILHRDMALKEKEKYL